MSEEIKNNEQDAELNLDDLKKVAGGTDWNDLDGTCPFCRGTNVEWNPAIHENFCLDCDLPFGTWAIKPKQN